MSLFSLGRGANELLCLSRGDGSCVSQGDETTGKHFLVEFRAGWLLFVFSQVCSGVTPLLLPRGQGASSWHRAQALLQEEQEGASPGASAQPQASRAGSGHRGYFL